MFGRREGKLEGCDCVWMCALYMYTTVEPSFRHLALPKQARYGCFFMFFFYQKTL